MRREALFFERQVIYKASCSSTNTVALQFLSTGKVPEGTVFITDHQYSGRGQRGSVWTSEPYKNLTCSVILYPSFLAARKSFALNIITTLAIQQVIAPYVPHGLTIKWPNDIYYQNQKLGGILIESLLKGKYSRAAVIGIGLNVNQESFTWPTLTSLALVCKRTFSLRNLLADLLAALEINYTQLREQGIALLQAHYLKNLYWIDESHTFRAQRQTFQGIIRGIDAVGRLVVEQASGITKHYDCKEITFVT